MLRQVTVYGTTKNTSGETVRTFKNGVAVEMRSHDDGKTWFMRADSMMAVRSKPADIPTLSDREKGWLDLVELPMAAANVNSMRHAYRMDRSLKGAE